MSQELEGPYWWKDGDFIAAKQYYGRRSDAMRHAVACNERLQKVYEELEEKKQAM